MAAGNVLLTNDIILKEALMEFENNLALTKVARRTYDGKFNPTTGNTIRIRKPTRYVVRTGRNLELQDIDEQYTNLTIQYQDGVDIAITSADLALKVDDFNRTVLSPAMVALANKVDTRLYGTTLAFSKFAGTAGTAPNSTDPVEDANMMLNALGVPQDERYAMFKSNDASALRKGVKNYFNTNLTTDVLLKGRIGELANFDMYDVQNVIRPIFAYSSAGVALANAAALGTVLINGANQSGYTLVMDGVLASATIKKGTTFSITGVNSVNPLNRDDTGLLANFVVTADTTADGSGNITLPIMIDDEPITLTGPYQSVTNLPADNAVVNFNQTHNKNIAFHRDAFAIATVPLNTSQNGVWQRNVRNPESTGLNIRMSRQYSINNDADVIRFDIFYGVKCFPEFGGIIMGS